MAAYVCLPLPCSNCMLAPPAPSISNSSQYRSAWETTPLRSEKSGHWLDIALRGPKSNRDGICARIRLVSWSGTQYNHMTTSVGYASSSDGPVHFGLGPDSRADVIGIRWPSRITETLTNVASDAVVKVVEPSR